MSVGTWGVEGISVGGWRDAPDEEAVEVERHRAGGAVRGIQPRGEQGEKFVVAIFRDRIEERSQPGRAVPLNDVGGRLYRMMKRHVIAVDPIVAELREHRGINGLRVFAEGALQSGEDRVPG